MAKTQKYYRFKGRNPRYTTKLSSFANGMYLSEQQIPEGYAKALVNLDIDDTGNHVRPRYGKSPKFSYYWSGTPCAGAAHLADYLYGYVTDGTSIETIIADIYMSFGVGVLPEECIPGAETFQDAYKKPVFVCAEKNEIYRNGTHISTSYGQPSWGCKRWDKETDDPVNYEYVIGNYYYLPINIDPDIGFITAREFKEPQAFGIPVLGGVDRVYQNEQSIWKSTDVLRPIFTVMNNELYAFVGGPLTYEKHLDDPSQNRMTGFNKPALAKLRLTRDYISYADSYRYNLTPEFIEPRVITPGQAYAMGFNYLLDNPYHFEDKVTGNLTILGALPYDTSSDYSTPKLKLNIGEPVKYRIYYTYPTGTHSVKVKVELLDNALGATANLEVLQDFTDSPVYNVGDVITYIHTPNTESAILRFTLRMDDNTATDVSAVAPVDTTANSDISDADYITPDLTTAKGMFSWQNCLGLYGIEGLEDTLIFSDTEQPDYFPMPYNKITFDNKVLAVHNYLSNLIVVTVDGVWLVTAGSSIQASTKKRVLTNVFIPELDAYNLITYKDQIFFKTDTQFYSLKPNAYTSDATDLKNYINSVAISNLTKDFKGQVLELLNEVYKDIRQDVITQYVDDQKKTTSVRDRFFTDINIGDSFVALRNEDIHYMYKCSPVWLEDGVQTSYGDTLLIHLVYNTTTRAWRLYLESCGSITSKGYASEYYPVWHRDKQTGDYYEAHPIRPNDYLDVETPFAGICLIKQDYDRVDDKIYIPDSIDESRVLPGIDLGSIYVNYTYIDTGVLAIEDALTKRWREVQFNIHNTEHAKLKFKTDFLLDGVKRIDHTHYNMFHVTDPEDVNYGVAFLTLTETDTENMFVYGDTVTQISEPFNDEWELDLTKFPDLSTVTVRFELHGRGRRPRLKLLNTTFGHYELADINWVYRIMNARQGGER